MRRRSPEHDPVHLDRRQRCSPVSDRSRSHLRVHPVTSSQVTVMTAWAPITAYANGSYCWRVKALDAAGNTISTSSTRTFIDRDDPAAAASRGLTFIADQPGPRCSTAAPGAGWALRQVQREHRPGLSRSRAVSASRATPWRSPVTSRSSVRPLPATWRSTPTPDQRSVDLGLNFPLATSRAITSRARCRQAASRSLATAPPGAKTDFLLDVTGYFLENNAGATYYTVDAGPPRSTAGSANGLTGPRFSRIR